MRRTLPGYKLAQTKCLSYITSREDFHECQVFIAAVPTPVGKANRPDMTLLLKAGKTEGKVMPQGIVVICESTVYFGAAEEVCMPLLGKFCGLKFNQNFNCGYR